MKCEHRVWDGRPPSKPCGRPATHEADGQLWCREHLYLARLERKDQARRARERLKLLENAREL